MYFNILYKSQISVFLKINYIEHFKIDSLLKQNE